MPAPREISASRQLLVEGRDAEVLFRALLSAQGLTGIQVQDFGSITELRGFLKALVRAPGFAEVVTLGVVRDAETDAAAAYQSVCGALAHAGLPTPGAPGPSGAAPRVAVFILPDGTAPGMLETVCLESVTGDPATPCLEPFFECVRQQGGALPGNMVKARLHAFLATRPKPDLLLGQAAHAGYWPWASPAFERIKQFLASL